jgi:predicted hydrocarbon binding protein
VRGPINEKMTQLSEKYKRALNRLRPVRSPEKLGYPELVLLSALKKEGCPICHSVSGSDREYFFRFFYESHRETEVLEELTRSLGFCRSHAHYLIGRGNGRAQLATVHWILARQLRTTLLDYRSRKSWKAGVGGSSGSSDRCPACRSRDEAVERAAFFLAKLIEDPRTEDRYAEPGLLCLPHLRLIAPRLANVTLERLLIIHEAAMASTLSALGEVDVVEPLNSESVHGSALHLAVGHNRGLGGFAPLVGGEQISPTADPVERLVRNISRTDACPICLEIGRAWLDWTAWLDTAAQRSENIEDVLPRCPDHVWAILPFARLSLARWAVEKALEVALTRVRFVIKKFREKPPPPDFKRPVQALMSTVRGGKPFLRVGRDTLARDFHCPLCNLLNTVRDRTLLLLVRLLEQHHQRARFEAGYGLCLKHFARAFGFEVDSSVMDFLCQVQAAKLGVLEWELEEYSRKSAWQARPEAKGAEYSAHLRALRRFSGCLKPDSTGPGDRST